MSAVPQQVTRKSRLPGWNVLLVGATGTGKTTCIGQLAEMGLNVRCLFTEPGMETVFKYFADRDKELPPNLHWKYIAPVAPSWEKLIDSATKINTMSFKLLSELSDINKKEYDEFLQILTALSNFKSDRDGTAFGPADSWGTDTVLCFDSLSGLNLAAMNLVVGTKPVRSVADWGVAMSNLEFFITKLTTDLRCHFVMTAHLEREADEMTGGSQLMASTLGKKLAPRLPRFFSDVVHTVREGDKFYWSTLTNNVDLKARNLPLKDKMVPDFRVIMNSWEKNGGVIEP